MEGVLVIPFFHMPGLFIVQPFYSSQTILKTFDRKNVVTIIIPGVYTAYPVLERLSPHPLGLISFVNPSRCSDTKSPNVAQYVPILAVHNDPYQRAAPRINLVREQHHIPLVSQSTPKISAGCLDACWREVAPPPSDVARATHWPYRWARVLGERLPCDGDLDPDFSGAASPTLLKPAEESAPVGGVLLVAVLISARRGTVPGRVAAPFARVRKGVGGWLQTAVTQGGRPGGLHRWLELAISEPIEIAGSERCASAVWIIRRVFFPSILCCMHTLYY